MKVALHIGVDLNTTDYPVKISYLSPSSEDVFTLLFSASSS